MRTIHAISAKTTNNQTNQEERRTSCCEIVCCDCSNTKPRAAVLLIVFVCSSTKPMFERLSYGRPYIYIHSYALCYAHNFRLFAQEWMDAWVCAHILNQWYRHGLLSAYIVPTVPKICCSVLFLLFPFRCCCLCCSRCREIHMPHIEEPEKKKIKSTTSTCIHQHFCIPTDQRKEKKQVFSVVRSNNSKKELSGNKNCY